MGMPDQPPWLLICLAIIGAAVILAGCYALTVAVLAVAR